LKLEEKFPIFVLEEEANQRLDVFLSNKFKHISRNRWSRLIGKGCFLVDSQPASSSKKVRSGSAVELALDDVQFEEPKWDPKSTFSGSPPLVLHEEDSFVVLNKPKGLIVHVGAGHSFEETLVCWLLNTGRLKEENLISFGEDAMEEARPGIVHRLDKDTSGAIVVAKNNHAQIELSKQFFSKCAGRKYMALVCGKFNSLREKMPRQLSNLIKKYPDSTAFKISEEGFSLATLIARDESHRTRFCVSGTKGKSALTHLQLIKSSGDYSLIKLRLDTGRTHQIRVHLSFLNFPIVGDKLYKGVSSARLQLHARELELIHPHSGKKMKFQADLFQEELDFYKTNGLL